MKKKIIEVVEGYISNGETGHIISEIKFGEPTWGFPIVYKGCPNPDNFRKVRITVEMIK